jgi:hypothetical protein
MSLNCCAPADASAIAPASALTMIATPSTNRAPDPVHRG